MIIINIHILKLHAKEYSGSRVKVVNYLLNEYIY